MKFFRGWDWDRAIKIIKFNSADNYTLYPLKNGTTGTKIAINETNISWKYDRDNFKNTKFPEKQWMDHENGIFEFYFFRELQNNHFLRAFPGLDASSWTVEIQEALGQDFRPTECGGLSSVNLQS